MRNYKKETIEKKVAELWKSEFFYDEVLTVPRVQPPEIEVTAKKGRVEIKISKMYGAPGLHFSQLKALSEFFETENINDSDHFHYDGCETCDYGSSHGFTLVIT